MLNIVAVIGRIVNDVELKITSNGVSVCSFTVAVDRNFVPKGEDRKSDFIDVVTWRNTAEFVSKYFRKGSLIAINGSLQTRTYEDNNHVKRKVTEIIADNINFCESKQVAEAPNVSEDKVDEEDLPF